MSASLPTTRSHVTLALCTIVHAFTHAYGSMLVPLYLLISADLKLPGVNRASLIVTLYGLVYSIFTYGAGWLADRVDRRLLLGVGLLGNAGAILCIGFCHAYWMIVALAMAGALFGMVYHPAANALVPAHYPKSPGMVLGFLGAGSGLGFFFGPQFAGLRAEHGWNYYRGMAGWQRPCIELGIIGLIFGIIFILVAREARSPVKAGVLANRPPMDRALAGKITAIACIIGCRDFAGVAGMSLASIFLQRAYHYTTKEAGLALGLMMLVSVVGNPLAAYLTHGKRRLPSLTGQLIVGGLIVAAVPWVGARWVVPVLVAFQTCQLTSYAVSDAAMLERVSPELRGRVVGLFLTFAGTLGATGPWIMGKWTDALGTRAADAHAYFGPYLFLAGMIAFAAFSTPLLARLGPVLRGATPSLAEEISPATMEGAL